MHSRVPVVFAAVGLILLGAGCGSSAPTPTPEPTPQAIETPTPPTSAPVLAITHPANGARITETTVTVTGTTDADVVKVNGKQARIENGAWNMPLAIHLGDNFVRVEATKNGTSASAEINIIGAEPEPKPATTGTTAPKPAPTAKPKPVTTTPTPTPTAPKPPTVTFVSDNLQGSYAPTQYGIDLRWTRSLLGNKFKGYAIVKSTTDSSPYYPKTQVSIFYSDIGSTFWSDRNAEKGKTTYYRICALALDDTTQCGNVVAAVRP